jgi:hypothetical protein
MAAITGPTDPLQRIRKLTLSQFTASTELIVFPVLLASHHIGLMVIDRRTDRRRLVTSEATFQYPQLSRDGKRLLAIRIKGGISQLLSCEVKDWKCRVAAESADSIINPVELDRDRILYVSSPLTTQHNAVKPYNNHDFYLSEPSREPVRLTDFQLYQLGPLDFFDRKLMFSASGGPKPIIPKMQPLADSRSDIFAISFDPKNPQIVTPEHTLEPLYLIDKGDSSRQAVSPDGTKVAFINTWTNISPYRYDLVIATMEGAVLKRVDASTFTFSRPAFVGSTTVLANQLFKDRYEVTMVDLANNSVGIATTVDHSENALPDLEHIQITGVPN